MKKSYRIVTYGCAMNRSDSERIAATLEGLGFQPARKNQAPDLLIFNACSVRQSAIDRIYGQVENLAKMKRKNPQLKVLVTGCILPQDRPGFSKRFDLIFNVRDISELPGWLQGLNKLAKGKKPSQEEIRYFKIEPRSQSKFSALVPVSFGCNRFCTYCAVPYTRGLEIDRPGADIIAEVANLISRGFKEIWLLGQTVSSWKDPKNPRYEFVDILAEIEKMPGKFWLRFASPYVLDFDEKLIGFLAQAQKVNNYLNLPLQSGDDVILKRMNRRYSVAEYLRVLSWAKKQIPDFNFSTDIIVGFCGETEKQFQNTHQVFARIKPAMAYIARYSPRPGTVAQKFFKDNVSQKVKKARYEKLTRLLRKTAKENLQKEVGRTLDVLVDTWLAKKKESLGKTRNYKTIRFKSKKGLVGQFVRVKILEAREFELEGKPT